MKKFVFFLSLLTLLFLSSPAFAQEYVIEGVAKDFIAPNADRTAQYLRTDLYETDLVVGIGSNQGTQLQFSLVPSDVSDYNKVEVCLYDTYPDSYYYVSCTNTGLVYGLKEGTTRLIVRMYKNNGDYYSVQPYVYIVETTNPKDFETLVATKNNIQSAYNTYILPMTDTTTAEALTIKNTYEDLNASYTAFTPTGETKLLNFYNFIRKSAGLNTVVWNNVNHSKIQKGADYLGTTGKRGHNAADNLGAESDEYFALHNSNLYYGSTSSPPGYTAALSFLREGFDNIEKFEGHRTSLMKENTTWIDVATNNGDVVWHHEDNYDNNTKIQAYPFIGDFPIEFLEYSELVPWSITFPTKYNNLMGAIQKIIVVDKTSGMQVDLYNTTSPGSKSQQDWFYQPASPVHTISFYPYSLLKNQGCFAAINTGGYIPVTDHTFEVTLIGEKNNFTYETTFFSMTKENFKNIKIQDLNIDFFAAKENGIKEEQTVYLGKIANLALSTSPEIKNVFYDRLIADPSIIKFNEDYPSNWNFITGLKEGETTVTFKGLGKEKTITVKVVDPEKIKEEPVDTPEQKPDEGIEEDTSTPQNPSEDNNTTQNPNNSSQENQNTNTNTGNIPVYRLYHPGTGEHLYTTDKNEVTTLVRGGTWEDEGTGWYSPTSGEAVYRLYSPVTRAHLFTTDVNEVNTLASSGWSVDNNRQPLFYSGGSTPVYRLYNPTIRMHLITKDLNEYNILPSRGWQAEGAKLKAL